MQPTHNIEWLVDSNKNDLALSLSADPDHTTKIQFPYPPDLASGTSEHTQGLDGIAFIQDKHEFITDRCPPTICLGNFKVSFPEPVFIINTVHTGSLELTDLTTGKTSLRRQGEDLFSHRIDSSIEQTVRTDEAIHATYLTIPVSQMSRLLDDETMALIFEQLKIRDVQSFSSHRVPLSISQTLEHCVDHSLRNSLKVIYLQARVLDYLCSLALHLNSDLVKTQRQKLSETRARSVHNFLLAIGPETPTLNSLSKQFGTSASKLNSEFVSMYGKSIFSFLTDYRLEQSRLAIEKSDLPLKLIAHRVGYSHVNHFITAFRRKYKQTPGSLRA